MKQTTGIDETPINGPAGTLAVADFCGTGHDMLLLHGPTGRSWTGWRCASTCPTCAASPMTCAVTAAFALLEALTVPALSIHGTRRPAALVTMPDDVRGFLTTVMDSIDADLELLSASNPSARVALVADAGHMVHLDAPATGAGHIQEFLAQL